MNAALAAPAFADAALAAPAFEDVALAAPASEDVALAAPVSAPSLTITESSASLSQPSMDWAFSVR